MVEHVDISDPEIHEPKGASTAADTAIYVADGAGSGTWTTLASLLDFGWEFVEDSSAAQVITTTASKLGINATGALSDDTYLPPSIVGTDTLWDTVNNKITPIALGDVYLCRLTLPVTATTGSPTRVIVEIDVAGGVNPTDIIETIVLPVYKSAPFQLSAVFPLYVTANMLTNGAQIFLSVDAATSVDVDDPKLLISRIYRSF